MKRNPYYQLQYIADIPYLVTFGQGHADFLHDLRLNDTGAFLWEQLKDTEDLEQLVSLCAEHYHYNEQQYAMLRADIKKFVDALYTHGILLQEDSDCSQCSPCTTLQIAGLYCNIHAPEELLASELLDFATTSPCFGDTPLQNIYIMKTPPVLTENGYLLLRNDMLSILELEEKFILLFPASSKIKEAHISKDGARCTIYCDADIAAKGAADISYVIRILFFYFALQNQILALHSSSICYRGKLWLFSAPSGTGKSTHAELWNNLLQVPIINGDINLLTIKQGIPIVCGNPWCGTSGLYDTNTYPLGGVFLLKQGNDNIITDLPSDEQQLFLLHRSLSPTWTTDLQEQNHTIVNSLCKQILVKRLTCTISDDSVYCCKTVIDAHLKKDYNFVRIPPIT